MRKLQLAACGFVICLTQSQAEAYPVGPALPVAKVAEEADVVAKAKAVKSVKTQNAWFKDYAGDGFAVYETTFEVTSVIKGE